MSRVLLVAAAAVLVSGTVVTGAGPHSGGGQHDNVARLGIKIENAARVHGTLVMIFLVLVLATLWLIRRDRAPTSVQTRLTVLLVVLVAQAGVGYAQYFSDIPPLLVGIHIAGAAAVWSATLVFALGCFERTAPAITGVGAGRAVALAAGPDLGGTVATPFQFDRAWSFAVTPDELWTTLEQTDRYRDVVAVAARVPRRRRRLPAPDPPRIS